MKSFNSYFPVEIIFGAGTIEQIGQVCARYGDKVFAVFDPYLKGSSIAKRILNDLDSNGMKFVEFYDIVPNPRYTSIDKGAAYCIKEKCNVVMIVGGGSAIDTGKAISLVATHGHSSWDYTLRVGEKSLAPVSPCLPIITAPTTAGTGTEATHISVVNNPEYKLKAPIINNIIYPKVSIVDPMLMVSVPRDITALTGLDTFAHAFESFISVGANEWSEMLALKSIELFSKSIQEVVSEPDNIEARSMMALSCTLAGYAFTLSGLCLPHALGQPVSAITDAPHGGTLAACIPQVIEYTIPYAEQKFAKVAEIFDPSISSLAINKKAEKLPEIIYQLYDDIGVKASFGSYGLQEDDIPEMTELCFKSYYQDIKCHPKPTTKADVKALFKKCL